MPEQGSVPKPNDLFMGVIEFFAILVPGIVAVMVVGWAVGLRLPEKQELAFIGTVLVVGYVLGHILHGIGSFLDPWVYDPLFKPLDDIKAAQGLRKMSYFPASDKLYRVSKDAIASSFNAHQTSPDTKRNIGSENRQLPTGVYQWSRAWLRIHSAEATVQLDRLEADSKLFRSLSVLALGMLVFWKMLPAGVAGFLTVVILATVVCLWRYCDLRQKMVRACYLHFVLLRLEAIPIGREVHKRD